MAGRARSRLIGAGMLLGLALLMPVLMGQGCITSGPGTITPIETSQTASVTGGTSAAGPSLTFTYPLEDVAATIGQVITLKWTVTGSSNAAITLLLDRDKTYGNGNEIVIAPLILANDPVNGRSFDLDTSSLQASTYRIIARITDGTNPEQIVVASGRLLLYGAGLLPGNVSPTIVVTEPMNNLGVSQSDVVNIRFCGRDIDDDGKTPATLAQILLILDLDNDPTNDIDLSGSDATDKVKTICQSGTFPVAIRATSTSPPSAYVLACFTDAKCGATTTTTTTDSSGNTVTTTTVNPDQSYQLTIDVGSIPPRADGLPYYVRGLMWDHVNKPVNSYAPGTVSITAAGSGLIDLTNIGHTISGTKFQGLNAGDRAGYTGADLGDMNGDGAEDFAIVSRYGRGYELGNIGFVHLVMGLTNKGKFAAEIPLNSVGTTYSGVMLTASDTPGTQGITSVTRVTDVTGDGKPDVLVGLPYVEEFPDHHDDDPIDSTGCCYGDGLPNPLSVTGNPDYIGPTDRREGTILINDIPYLCSNDQDLNRQTPVNGGYAILAGSDMLPTTGASTGVHYLVEFGENLLGLKIRGAWYPIGLWDITKTRQPNIIDPTTLMGMTVSSMPPMQNTSLLLSPRYGTTMIISAPGQFVNRGMVMLEPVQGVNWPHWCNGTGTPTNTDSLPCYSGCGPCCRKITYPGTETYIVGKAQGDQLGYAKPAGDFNLDGSRDIAMGAPGASRDGFRANGVVYVMFGRNDWPTNIDNLTLDLRATNPPRLEIHGIRDDDQFGTMQTIVGDVNQDGLPDIGFSSPYADGPGGVDSGYVGIVFGGRRLTGENVFYTESRNANGESNLPAVATAQLPGVKFYGIQPGGHAGAVINNAGDFNGDSIDDFVITAPDEVRTVNGTQRRGVTYLIFGGPHLSGNKSFNLSQVGTTDLPGIVFVSPYTKGTAEEAPTDWAGAAGDVNGDGFDDIMIGISEADYVDPLDPSQRRNDAGEMYLIYGSNTGSNTVTAP